MRRITIIILALLAAGVLWVVLASAILCQLARIPFASPYDQWLVLAPTWLWFGAGNWYSSLLVIVSAVIASSIVVMGLFCLFVAMRWRYRQRRRLVSGLSARAVERGSSSNLGTAAWATKENIATSFPDRGCLIGAANRSERSRLIFSHPGVGSSHSLVFAGPGGLKSTSAVTRLWHWRGPRVVFDPSCELGPIMTEALREAGFNVVSIGIGAQGFNALDWLDPANTECDAHVRVAVDHLYASGAANRGARGSADNAFWDTQARSLISCLMAHMIYRPDGPKTLRMLRQGVGVSETDLQTLLKGIAATSPSAMAREIAAGFSNMGAPETWSGIVSNAKAGTDWISVQNYADVVSGDAMRSSDILDPSTVVFVQLPLRTLLATPAIGRVVVAALFNALFSADGNVAEPVLFQIDEAAVLGPLKEILLCYATARKYRGVVSCLFQSEAQLSDVFGQDGAKTIRDSVSWRSYNAIQDGDIAERLSRDIGEHAVMAYSEGDNRGQSKPFGLNLGSSSRGSNLNVHEIKRRLVRADEIMRAASDEMFVLCRDVPWPVRCVAAPYFRYPEISGLMSANRFARTAPLL